MRESWSRALDLQMDYHRWCSSDGGKLYNLLFFADTLEKAAQREPPLEVKTEETTNASILLQQHLVQTLWQADTMFVTSDMLHVLMQAAADLPEDAAFDEHVLITPCGFCLFEEPIVREDGQGGQTAMTGIAWRTIMGTMGSDDAEVNKMLLIYFLVDPDDTRDTYTGQFNQRMREAGMPEAPLTLQHFYPTRFGRKLDREAPASVQGSHIITETLAVFIAMQLLAQQRMGEPIRMRPERAVRKRAAKWHEGDRYITLITLRLKSDTKDDHEPQPVDWSHRWLVKGHWRKQYYPKTKTHDYVYIFGYVKGPEDKPLVVRERRVFDFRR
jgi:hypothetical protein